MYLHESTVEPWYKEPLYSEVFRMTNDFFYPSNSKIDEKEPWYNEQNNFASPLALRHVEVPPPVLTEDTVFTSRTGERTKSSTSLEQRRVKAIPSLLSCFKYQYSQGNQTRDLSLYSKALYWFSM